VTKAKVSVNTCEPEISHKSGMNLYHMLSGHFDNMI